MRLSYICCDGIVNVELDVHDASMNYKYVRFYYAGRLEVEETFDDTVQEDGHDFAGSVNKVLSGELSMKDAVERESKAIYKRSYTPDRVDFVTEFADLIRACGGDTERAYNLLCKGIEDALFVSVDAHMFDAIDEALEKDEEDGGDGGEEDDMSANPGDDEEDEENDEESDS